MNLPAHIKYLLLTPEQTRLILFLNIKPCRTGFPSNGFRTFWYNMSAIFLNQKQKDLTALLNIRPYYVFTRRGSQDEIDKRWKHIKREHFFSLEDSYLKEYRKKDLKDFDII